MYIYTFTNYVSRDYYFMCNKILDYATSIQIH